VNDARTSRFSVLGSCSRSVQGSEFRNGER
jgi:hypothetical protein